MLASKRSCGCWWQCAPAHQKRYAHGRERTCQGRCGAQVLEGDTQRPQSTIAPDHRRGCRQQQPVSLVDRLGAVTRNPVDRVLQRVGHRGVLLGRGTSRTGCAAVRAQRSSSTASAVFERGHRPVVLAGFQPSRYTWWRSRTWPPKSNAGRPRRRSKRFCVRPRIRWPRPRTAAATTSLARGAGGNAACTPLRAERARDGVARGRRQRGRTLALPSLRICWSAVERAKPRGAGLERWLRALELEPRYDAVVKEPLGGLSQPARVWLSSRRSARERGKSGASPGQAIACRANEPLEPKSAEVETADDSVQAGAAGEFLHVAQCVDYAGVATAGDHDEALFLYVRAPSAWSSRTSSSGRHSPALTG